MALPPTAQILRWRKMISSGEKVKLSEVREFAYGIALTGFVGQNYGAGLTDRVRKGTRQVLMIEMATAVVMTIAFNIFGPVLLSLFTTDSHVVDLGMQLVRMLTPFYAVYAISEITGATLRAEGHVLVNTAANLIGVCVFRIIWVTLVFPSGTFRQILACYPISWTLITIFIAGFYLRNQGKILAGIGTED